LIYLNKEKLDLYNYGLNHLLEQIWNQL
jgi:hypothetical protein